MIFLTDSEYAEIAARIKKDYAIDMAKKKSLVENRLNSVLISKGFDNYKKYFEMVFNDKSGVEMNTVLGKITTNHTSFMREKDHFEFFMNTVLPNWENNCKTNELRMWCAASSTGEEPYNLAMCVSEYLGSKKSKYDTKFLASDISLRVLEKAKEAIYAPETVATLPAEWVRKYFNKLPDGNFQVCTALRNEVIFRQINLQSQLKFKGNLDIIFCRNVMIYFDSQTKDELVTKFYDLLKPGGYLIIGHAESINKDKAKLKYVKPSIYQK
ncbi:MAG: protein-glutamate O-methyltransferase CheR [Oscillospiraceae bacterium]